MKKKCCERKCGKKKFPASSKSPLPPPQKLNGWPLSKLVTLVLYIYIYIPLSIPKIPYSQFKMASVSRRTNPVDYVNLNNLSSEVLYESGKKPKGKFFQLIGSFFLKKVSHVSLC